jgi:hypothetical protein
MLITVLDLFQDNSTPKEQVKEILIWVIIKIKIDEQMH